jgi:hypothetical protein
MESDAAAKQECLRLLEVRQQQADDYRDLATLLESFLDTVCASMPYKDFPQWRTGLGSDDHRA